MSADFTRQLDILAPSDIVHPLTLIGLGGIGSHTAYTMRKLGFERFTLWDPDCIEGHNIPSQHFNAQEKGSRKACVVAAQLRNALESRCFIDVCAEHFVSGPLEGIVISGVDSMEARTRISR